MLTSALLLRLVRSYAHRRNVIHFDLKLQNILLDRSLRVKISAFGETVI